MGPVVGRVAQEHQSGDQLARTLGQYDAWKAGNDNDSNWPGQPFDVPLLLTEIGFERAKKGKKADNQQQQFDILTNGIAERIRNYLMSNAKTKLIGYCIFEFNDEPCYGKTHGVFMLSDPIKVKFVAKTGITKVSWTEFKSADYPIEELDPVKSKANKELLKTLSEIIAKTPARA